jgi:hypothetical protein
MVMAMTRMRQDETRQNEMKQRTTMSDKVTTQGWHPPEAWGQHRQAACVGLLPCQAQVTRDLELLETERCLQKKKMNS